jgi:hypothetical protein
MEKALLVYTTFPDMETAERLGRELVGRQAGGLHEADPGHARSMPGRAPSTGQEVAGIIKAGEGSGVRCGPSCARRDPDIAQTPTARLSARRRVSQALVG